MQFLVLGILALILACMIGTTVICLKSGARSKSILEKIVCWLAASFAPCVFAYLMRFLRLDLGANALPWTAVGASFFLTLCALWLLIIFQWVRKRAVWISWLALSCCVWILTGVYAQREAELANLPTLAEYDVLSEYNPMDEENKCARLEEESQLTLTESLPRLDGATALYPIYASFARAVYPESLWAPEIPWNFDSVNLLMCNKTSNAYRNLVDGDADIIFVAAPSEEQRQYAEEKGEEMIFTPIGREAFVFFVSSKNPIEGLSSGQIRDIYSGKITRWRDLGANLGDIRAYQRNEGSGSQSALLRFMDGTPVMDAPTEDVVDNMAGIVTQTADYKNYPNAIGYSFRFYCTEMLKNHQIRLLAVDGVEPTRENIQNGRYPITDVFYAVYLSSNENPNIKPFIEWMLSVQGQSLIEQTGYVSA